MKLLMKEITSMKNPLNLVTKEQEKMPKNVDKIKKALEIRIKNHKGPGGKVPGSMNKKKTGYAK